MRSIAICQYQWPLQMQEVNLVQQLREDDFTIDLFLFECREGELVNLNQFASDSGIAIHNIHLPDKKKSLFFKRALLSLQYRLKIREGQRSIILKDVFAQSQKVFKDYDFIIGIEKRGLIWAGQLSRQNSKEKLIYYSLELYLEKEYFSQKIPQFNKLRWLEKKYHRRCLATIIQNEERAKVLFQFNKVSNRPIFLPVSVKGNKINERGLYFHSRFALPVEKKIILYFGMFGATRYSVDLMQSSKNLGTNEILVLHGYGADSAIKELKSLENDRGRLSLELIPDSKIGDLVASCDIGIALYGNQCYNDRLTAFSSEKIALYARAGKPFIAFDYESYRILRNEFLCCELIHTVGEIPQAINTILHNYGNYSQNVFKAYDKYYNFDHVGKNLSTFLTSDLN